MRARNVALVLSAAGAIAIVVVLYAWAAAPRDDRLESEEMVTRWIRAEAED